MHRRPLTLLSILVLAAACGGNSSSQTGSLSREELLDPNSCKSCHQEQFNDWAGSMHAYSSQDPVFLAMNKRGQRETKGALGKFCVNCHAPMAVREGATTDGLNLDQVDPKLKGVTCFFCHTVESVTDTHDNPLQLASDNVLRGSISDPYAAGRTHGAAYSPLVDRNRIESAQTCGACHDIVNGHGAAIERTFSEWKKSAFATTTGTTCGQCHMPQSTDTKAVAQVPGAPTNRRSHGHTMPGIDMALTPFPDTVRQKQQIQALLDTTMQTAICVEPLGGKSQVSVIMDNAAAGHGFPSGSEQDRRAWVELIASAGGTEIYSSGKVAAGEAATANTADQDRWLMRDCMLDDKGQEVHMFWEAFSFETNGLPAISTFDVSSPDFYQTHKQKFFPATQATISNPDQITLRVRVEPVGLEVVDSLIASGDLDPAVKSAFTTLQAGSVLTWTPTAPKVTYVNRNTGNTVQCVTTTNLNVAADRFPALTKATCFP